MKKTALLTTVEDIEKKLNEQRIALHDVRHGSVAGKRKNVHEARMIKKDIARLMTQKTALQKA